EIENEDLVNAPNWLSLRFRTEDSDWFTPTRGSIDGYRQELDLRRGILVRSFTFTDSNRRTLVTQRRFVHMGNPHLAGLQTTFTAENWQGRLTVRSALDGTVENTGVARYRSLAHRHLAPVTDSELDPETIVLEVETNQSAINIAMAARTRLVSNGGAVRHRRHTVESEGFVAHDLTIDLAEGVPVTIDKIVTVSTSRDQAISTPALAVQTLIETAPAFDDLLAEHILAWEHLWTRFRLETGADDETRLAINLHVFHLLQTASKHTIDLDVGIPARGLHGEAYRGHVFWDELFIFPFLTLHLPDLTRSLLLYRYRRLTQARVNAAAEGLDGALYPWQSSSDGREESQVLHLNPKSGRWLPDNSRLQRHVNLAIAWNVWLYHRMTADTEFLAFAGAEMLVEISRMLVSLTSYDRAHDRYEIKGVMGPDEYHDSYPHRDEPGLDNNTYTNVMTSWVLDKTRQALSEIPEFRSRELIEKLNLRPEELSRWDDIASKLVVPTHEGVISQFEGYGDLEEFDWVGYSERYGDIQRLDRILEAENDSTNRYKLSKQADVLMLFYLLPEDELSNAFERLGVRLDEDLIERTIDYYDHRTSHGSTLSRVVHSWVLARLDRKESWRLFEQAVTSDLIDIQGGTTKEGIHTGAMAGTVDLVQRGYTGLRVHGDTLVLDPAIPPELGSLSSRIRFRGHWLGIEISTTAASVSLESGSDESISVRVRSTSTDLEPGETLTVDLG
ncbi:MAG: glycoside hydrolase family 65 protein, partial [Acidimicrobiia bacterium]|nr:glycoside hydrolase family 65 protein [Acidimicrobiia bacterium]